MNSPYEQMHDLYYPYARAWPNSQIAQWVCFWRYGPWPIWG